MVCICNVRLSVVILSVNDFVCIFVYFCIFLCIFVYFLYFCVFLCISVFSVSGFLLRYQVRVVVW